MRLVLTAGLVEHDRRRRYRVDPIAEPVADVHEDVGDVTFLVNDRRFRQRRGDVSAGKRKGMLGLAERITTHTNHGAPWRLAVELHVPGHDTGTVGLGRRNWRLRCGLTTSTCGRNQSYPDKDHDECTRSGLHTSIIKMLRTTSISARSSASCSWVSCREM